MRQHEWITLHEDDYCYKSTLKHQTYSSWTPWIAFKICSDILQIQKRMSSTCLLISDLFEEEFGCGAEWTVESSTPSMHKEIIHTCIELTLFWNRIKSSGERSKIGRNMRLGRREGEWLLLEGLLDDCRFTLVLLRWWNRRGFFHGEVVGRWGSSGSSAVVVANNVLVERIKNRGRQFVSKGVSHITDPSIEELATLVDDVRIEGDRETDNEH